MGFSWFHIFFLTGSFLDSYPNSKVSGIHRYSLKSGKAWSIVKDEIKKILTDKLIITVAGETDLFCLDLKREDYADTFDLQSFYIRPHPDIFFDFQPMSLRDIFFHHFREDCQPRVSSNDGFDSVVAGLNSSLLFAL